MLRGHYTSYGLSICPYISMASFLPSNNAVVFNILHVLRSALSCSTTYGIIHATLSFSLDS